MEMFSNAERAQVLVQALPYIKRYTGKIVVVKYGGSAMTDENLKQQVMEDIVLLHHPLPYHSQCVFYLRREA